MNALALPAPLLLVSADWHARPYEQRKHERVATALGNRRFECAWVWGCGNAPLAGDIAARSGRLLATDGSRRALKLAALHMRDDSHVQLQQACPPRTWPAERFDFVLLDEIGSHLDDRDFSLACSRLAATLRPGALLVACHWATSADGTCRSGRRVHETLSNCFGPACWRFDDGELLVEGWRSAAAAREAATASIAA